MKIVIIGGVAGGASAAVRARRLAEEAEIIVLERGRYVSFANCGLPYHIGGVIPQRASLLLKTPEDFRQRFNLDVRVRHEVLAIDVQGKCIEVRDLTSGQVYRESYDRLLLSTGAAPLLPPLPGIESPGVFALRSIDDMDAILAHIASHTVKHATVVGGGFIGLEVTEALRRRGLAVTLLEMGTQVMMPVDGEMAVPLHETLRANAVDLRLQTALQAIMPCEAGLHLTLSEGSELVSGMVIMAIGVRPESRLAQAAGLALGASGGIRVDSGMRTSAPDIYAVGDAVEAPPFDAALPPLVPLAGPANRQGRIAADAMLGRASHYRGSQAASVCQIFDLTVASVGLSEKLLRRQQRPYETVFVHGPSHAGYYPHATPISLKLIFDPRNGAILGAQAVGKEGVDKRIDVLSVAQRAGLTVADLEHLELCYAPPYNSARDLVNQAGMLANNVLCGDTAICHVADLEQRDPARQCLLDIRSDEELATFGTYPQARHIPLDELRARLDELPRDKEILIGCQSGLRGHVAYRLLVQHGFRARNLTGGYITYRRVLAAQS
ncbi:FAD-dependent oxidoreductase [Edwardsiella tarda]|uniref:FAD-dependent oxidoreductase n=1 Tax=Edwardsiella tarda ATCC 15947 = NBRC 105688 TaxID=667121 RepID=A0AC61TEZ8_EDWTA|nr:FAD-dependent oxidoreductase [Edwardsiella tarda]UAL57645.1 FAD-dependent oxidoreductase [Edwardsiella tarda]UCP99296.1 FAD-dependent oxidoreductase [Edwardsiella tarda ATCC 15947 = NBRC 105688]UCQ10521.1 FAD-dependent oxidoreductase [Edwardsiella tarda]UCQ53421.1 FAD-dependent oxidoreductase [Edwardsiella tarda]STD30074.1 Coenzyme A disulfide reductase [Edwardsiella tarda]